MDLEHNRVLLPIDKIPKQWFNIKPYLPVKPFRLLLPNGQLADFDHMCNLFPQKCVIQSATKEEYVDIPQEVREASALNNRPTPLQRAFRLEKALGVDSDKVKIFFKCENMAPSESIKPILHSPKLIMQKKKV